MSTADKVAASVAGGFLAIIILGLFIIQIWTESNSSITKFEIDIKMIVPNTYRLEDTKLNKRRYLYEDDKVVIHSSFNNNRYIYTHDPNNTGYISGPSLTDDRAAKYLGDYGEISVWLKPDMILVYHSEINRNNQHATPRTQDKFRSNLVYHKGKWVEYIKTLAKEKRKEFYEMASPYREYKQLKAIEDKKWQKENKPDKREKERKKAQKVERKEKERIEKERLKKATTPIDDSKLFGSK
jgi:hypothetical protein